MIKNYFKTAFRSLSRNKGFTAINVLGLSVGLATCLLIVLYVTDELSYDSYNLKADRIYRISENARLNGNEGSYAGTEKPLQGELRGYRDIEAFARIIPKTSLFATSSKFNITKGDTHIQEQRVAFTESSTFDVFTLPIIDGSAKDALSDPHEAVINASTAIKYFGSIHATGKTLTINDTSVYKVTAVMKDIPENSHFNYDILLSFSSIPEYHGHWGYSGVHNYVLLKPGADKKALTSVMLSIAEKNYPKSLFQGANYFNYELTPVRRIHLYSKSQNELSPGGNIQYVYIFGVIGLFILLIACVNFMNLSTARSSKRAREVGVRKVLGSARSFLIAQFLAESILITLAASIIAIGLAYQAIPLLNNLTAKHLSLGLSSLRWLLPALTGVALVIGFLAGSYPAFFLSSFNPIEVLKGKFSSGSKGAPLRSFLVVSQFTVSIFLIIGTIVIYRQLNFIHNKSLGFNRDQVLVIKNVNTLGNQAALLKQDVKQLAGVKDATMTSYLPVGEERNMTGLFPQLPIDIKQDVLAEFWPADEDYINTFGIRIKTGRNFNKQMGTDSSAIIVNEALVKRFGFKDPIGKTLYRYSFGLQAFHIIGVMKDFHFSSLKDDIKPLALTYQPDRGAISAKISTANLSALMGQIKDEWKALAPNQPFVYSFMDHDFNATYRSEERIGELFTVFSSLAILIACLGVFGLAAYTADQRAHEIGIRKVLGASVSGIVRLLSADLVKLITIAILIAAPLGWYAMNKWLQGFAYRIDLQWWMILLAGAIALTVSLLTISFQSVRAAMANPVKTIKQE